MQVKVKSYGGIVGFYLRKIVPNFCSNAYLFLQRKLSNFPNKKYMVLNVERIIPLFVNIETISKCNGLCSFCCCNIKEDTRKTKIMDDLAIFNCNNKFTINYGLINFKNDIYYNKLMEFIYEK